MNSYASDMPISVGQPMPIVPGAQPNFNPPMPMPTGPNTTMQYPMMPMPVSQANYYPMPTGYNPYMPMTYGQPAYYPSYWYTNGR